MTPLKEPECCVIEGCRSGPGAKPLSPFSRGVPVWDSGSSHSYWSQDSLASPHSLCLQNEVSLEAVANLQTVADLDAFTLSFIYSLDCQ